jgi:hypothetical protein
MSQAEMARNRPGAGATTRLNQHMPFCFIMSEAMIKRLLIFGLGTACLLLAEEPPRQKVQISKTERIAFQPGGILRMKNSIGELTVEGWDRTDVEITTVKSTKVDYPSQEREQAVQKLDRIQIATQRNGDDLVITTSFPGGRVLPRFLGGPAAFDLDYRIKVPASTRLVVEHDVGEVHVDNLTSDIEVALHEGEITLHLPEQGQYTTSAKSNFGNVFSDYPGQEKRRFWLIGHRIEQQEPQTAHKLHLRVGYGDIIILKTRIPKMPGPVHPTPKQDGA